MCSIDEEYEKESNHILQNESKMQKSGKCNKCRTQIPNILLRNKGAYCKDCFILGTAHKFKAQIGKSKLLRPNDKVLVYHKIGHASTALLHFLRVGLDLNTPKKIQFQPKILFIDDYEKVIDEKRKEILSNVAMEIQSFGFKPNFISYLVYKSIPKNIGDIIYSKIENYENPFVISKDSCNKSISKTGKQYCDNVVMRQLLIDCAKHFECKFVFTPEISVDLSVQLLTNVSLGIGSQIPLDTGFCDDRNDIKILRPLRMFDLKELVFYNKFNNLEPLSIQKSEGNVYSSVQSLMENFLKDLQIEFPSTITTILKTGEKISASDTGQFCNVCKGFINPVQSQLCSEESIKFAQYVSTKPANQNLPKHARYTEFMDMCQQNSSKNKLLCYACSKIFNYINS